MANGALAGLPVPNPNERDRLMPGMPSLRPPGPEPEPIDGDYDVVDTDDGGAEIRFRDQQQQQVPFGANLAEFLDESELGILARWLRDRLNEDKQARSKRDEIYAEGIRRSGLGNDTPGGANFEGASKVVHPMLAEACVDFAALTMRELFPSDGPAKAKVFGNATPEKLEVAERQSRHLNWQLTTQMEEYSAELEQVLTQLGMGGSQFQKFWNDRALGRATTEFVPVDDILLPFAAADFWSSPRITHVMHLTRDTVEERIADGLYRDVVLAQTTYMAEQSKAAQASQKVEGKEPAGQNIDELGDYFETNGFFKISTDEKKRLPYLVTIDEHDRVLSIYRNWDEKDQRRRRLHWIVEYGFIPWRGAYKIGFPHLIGGLSIAGTGALRALLDSAHVNNAPTGVKLKASRVSGQSQSAEPTQIVEIEGPVMVDDIRKLIMPMPFNPPSAVLFQLLGWLTDAAKGVVTTAEEKIADAGNQMPVGTALALIEAGQKVMSSIFARLHRSQRKAFEILARLNRERDIEKEQEEELGEVLATRADYAQTLGVQPVSDPNIFTDAQRYAQNQALLQLSTQGKAVGVQYNDLAIHKRLLKTMRIPAPEEVLPDPPRPGPENIASADVKIMLGQMVPAFPNQDHVSHLEARFRLASDPVIASMYFDDVKVLTSLVQNIKMHVAFLYGTMLQQVGDKAIGGDLTQQDPRMATQVDQLLAAASKIAHTTLVQQMQPALQLFMALKQRLDQLTPPPPQDPTVVAEADSKRRAEGEQLKVAQKAEAEQRRDQLKATEAAEKAQQVAAAEAQRTTEARRKTTLAAAELERKSAADATDAANATRDQRRKDQAQAHQEEMDEAELALRAVEALAPGNQVSGV